MVASAPATALAGRLRETRRRLARSGPPPGRQWCAAWTATVDRTLERLLGSLGAPQRLTVVATGGYGRSELCPGSDLDLLLLHDGAGDQLLREVVRALVYPLWDADLTVGYAVRTPEEAVAAADEDPGAATALLDARVVAGDRLLARRAVDRTVARLREEPAAFLARLSRADAERRARAGDLAEVLEPDLKRGAGGLRDVQSLRWAAAALVGTCGLDPLVSARYLGAPDRARLARSYERLLAVRVALHLEAGRARDLLELERQGPVARRLGYDDGRDDRDTAAHRLLSDVFLAARRIDHVHGRAWRLLTADAGRGRRRLQRPPELVLHGLELVDGVARLAPGQHESDPRLPQRLIEVLSRQQVVLDRHTAGRIRRHAEDRGSWGWDDATRRSFLDMLWRGRPALRAVSELDDVGMVSALLPEWDPVRGRAQRNPFHRFAVDRHGWHAAAELAELVRREPWAATTLEAVEDRDGLMLGTWLHDIGKGYGEPHAETGVPAARSVAARLGVAPRVRDRVGRLVGLHLLLADVAERRDLRDPAEIRRVAEAVGDTQTLAALHLLTAADGLATGPTAWGGWKASLVQTLVDRVRAVLHEGDARAAIDDGAATAATAQRRAAEAGLPGGLVRRHLAGLPRRYAVAVAPGTVVRQARLADALTAARSGGRPVRVAPAPESDGHTLLEVVGVDRPGLLAALVGVLALRGADIVAAEVFTRDDGVAVDTVTLRPPDRAGAGLWDEVEEEVAAALGGGLDLHDRLARTIQLDERRRNPTAAVPTVVGIDTDARRARSILEVTTADRRGVLFDILHVIDELGLDVTLAKVQTLGHEVHDTFYLRGPDRGPLGDGPAGEVREAVRAAVRR